MMHLSLPPLSLSTLPRRRFRRWQGGRRCPTPTGTEHLPHLPAASFMRNKNLAATFKSGRCRSVPFHSQDCVRCQPPALTSPRVPLSPRHGPRSPISFLRGCCLRYGCGNFLGDIYGEEPLAGPSPVTLKTRAGYFQVRVPTTATRGSDVRFAGRREEGRRKAGRGPRRLCEAWVSAWLAWPCEGGAAGLRMHQALSKPPPLPLSFSFHFSLPPLPPRRRRRCGAAAATLPCGN